MLRTTGFRPLQNTFASLHRPIACVTGTRSSSSSNVVCISAHRRRCREYHCVPPHQFHSTTNSPSSKSKRSSNPSDDDTKSIGARRSLLYVPGSNVKMLQSALRKGTSDALILDLEDSVATGQKGAARQNVFDALQSADSSQSRSQLFVRINSPTRSIGIEDLEVVLKSSNLQGIVIPKVDTVKDVQVVDQFISRYGLEMTKDRIKIIASIESPLSLMNLKEIATYSKRVDSLLFAAEDYCASSNILRTESRTELLFVRSQIVAVAKAFGLNAVDLVRVSYKGETAAQGLEEEAMEGRRLGFDGKQCIHPNQIEVVQKCFTPSEKDIQRARDMLSQYEVASSGGAGAYGLIGEDGNSAMIDAPMLLQAQRVLAQAKAAGVLA